MLAHVLAVLLGLSSFIFYMAAFFYPEVHRRIDFWISALGTVCAVVLWFCAGQMTVPVVLAQLLLIVLLATLGWQTLSIRREKTPVYQQTPVVLTPEVVSDWAKNKINQLRIAPDDNVRPVRPQNPSLNATSAERFRQTLDPRRRPVYDYEFVEDGILLEADESAVADPLIEIDQVRADVVPPSAEAEVIVAIAPPEAPPEDQAEPDPLEAANAIAEPVIESAIEPATKSVMKPAVELAVESIAADSEDLLEPDTESDAESDDDWGLETEDSWADVPKATFFQENSTDSPNQTLSNPQTTNQSKLNKKPSALAIPIILLGWIKDVAVSFTKPKPPKPIIEIPRRDIPAAIVEPTAEPMNPPIAKSMADPATAGSDSPFAETSTPLGEPIAISNANLADDDSWEESNWDD